MCQDHTRYPPTLSHSTFCLVTGNWRLRLLKLPSLNDVNALFRSSWYFFSICAICFMTSGPVVLAESGVPGIDFEVVKRTLPSS